MKRIYRFTCVGRQTFNFTGFTKTQVDEAVFKFDHAAADRVDFGFEVVGPDPVILFDQHAGQVAHRFAVQGFVADGPFDTLDMPSIFRKRAKFSRIAKLLKSCKPFGKRAVDRQRL
jgi:hypothetical protein